MSGELSGHSWLKVSIVGGTKASFFQSPTSLKCQLLHFCHGKAHTEYLSCQIWYFLATGEYSFWVGADNIKNETYFFVLV